MGKSFAAAQLRELGYPVFSADDAVHALYAELDVIAEISALLPPNLRVRPFSRALVAEYATQNPGIIPALEKILHPRVRALESDFISRARVDGAKIAVLDIPLLLESGESDRCDYIAVMSAPKLIQLWRVMRRPGMTWRKLSAILARQMPHAEKKRRADFVVQGWLGSQFSGMQWRRILAKITKG